jgi:GNAT superfamily N-acetyltransferase
MINNRPRIYIREGKAADREAVVKFTEHTWEWGDFIPLVWDYWLEEPDSKWLVATINRQPVAIAHIAMLSATEAWLEGLRVDPAYRKQGIGTLINRRAVSEALRKGAEYIRFVTRSDNTPVHRIAAGMGFNKLFAAVSMAADAGKAVTGLPKPRAGAAVGIAAFLNNSPVMKETGGLISNAGWRYFKFTGEFIEEKLRQEMVRITGEPDNIKALAFIEEGYGDEGLVVTYLDGEPSSLNIMLSDLRSEAAGYDPPQVNLRTIKGSAIYNIAAAAGFKPGMEVWLYTLKI